MKTAIALIVQTGVFLILFLVGSLMDPFHLKWFVTQLSPSVVRYFVPDGLLLACGAYVLLLVVEVATKRLARSGAWTSAAFVLAVILGLLAKFGMVTHDLY